MTTTRKPRAAKGKTRKLKLKKETLKDLSPKNSARGVKGGMQNLPRPTATCGACTASCKNSVCNSCYDTDCCLMKP